MDLAQTNFVLALGTVALQVVAAALLLIFIFPRAVPSAKVSAFVGNWGLLLGFVLSLAATLLSLYYSEVLGILPCGLCWLQRIFMFPQVVLFGIALWKKDRGIADYIIGLSAVGGIIALYQHYVQMGGADILPCPAVSTAADCARRYIFEFNYITFPLMAFTIFAVLIVLMLLVRKASRG